MAGHGHGELAGVAVPDSVGVLNELGDGDSPTRAQLTGPFGVGPLPTPLGSPVASAPVTAWGDSSAARSPAG